MKKIWLFLTLGLAALLVCGAITLRIVAKSLVESEEFRSELREAIERGAGTFVPHAIAQVRQIRLVGLASVEIRGLELRSSKQIDARVGMPRVKVTPALPSLLGSSPLRLAGDGDLENKGSFAFTAEVPKFLLAGEPPSGRGVETLTVDGSIERLDVVGVSSLIFSEAPSTPNFRLTRGFLGGTFHFEKPFGRTTEGRKSGQIDAKLESAEWTLAVGPVKKIQPPPIDLKLAIHDYAVEIQKPVQLADKKAGSATISGALLFPKRADRTLAWDLRVQTKGIVVQGSLAKLFKCQSIPLSPHFTVKGPIAKTTCAAAK